MCWPFFPYGNGETGRLESKVYWCGDLNFKPFVSWFPRHDLHPWAWRQKKTCRILESCSRIPTKHTHHTSWRCIHLKIQEWGRNGVIRCHPKRWLRKRIHGKNLNPGMWRLLKYHNLSMGFDTKSGTLFQSRWVSYHTRWWSAKGWRWWQSIDFYVL